MDSQIESLSSRYIVDNLPWNADAEVRHFQPLSNGRDEFGNRLFSSPFSYLDRTNNEVKAGLLVSPEGEICIKSHKEILQDVDQTLNKFKERIDNEEISLLGEEKPYIEIGPGRKMTWLHSGGQSRTFLLEDGGEKFIIKTNVSQTPEYTDFSQPYINEMLQIQQLGKILEKDLEEANMKLPVFLFASGYVSCTKFVAGDHTIKSEDLEQVNNVVSKAHEFVESQNKTEGSLWENIHLDIGPEASIPVGSKNIIQAADKIVWVDPFCYIPKSGVVHLNSK